uniref:DUF6468 domain-containing protein n=1 Tax=Neokomagataea thailandica TaxID=661190 RepID=UPI00226595FD|nr:DUF6468 domain-containing protein [Neokomagataea thailandica]
MRRDRSGLEEMVAQFRHYSAEAQTGINQLQKSSDGVGRALAKTVEAGQALKQDLLALCERSEALAGQMEGVVFQRKPPEPMAVSSLRGRSSASRVAAPAAAEATGGLGKSAAERELLRALRQKQG